MFDGLVVLNREHSTQYRWHKGAARGGRYGSLLLFVTVL